MPKSIIPPKAKRVFKGEIFEVWQWPQKMYDGSIAIFEALRRPNAAQIIASVGNKIIIQWQSQPHKSKPFLSLPGGRCEAGEAPLESAKREFLEETGYVSKDWTLWRESRLMEKIDWSVFTYVARNCVFKQPPHLDAGEKIKLKFLNFEEFLKLAKNPLFRSGLDIITALERANFDPKFKKEFKRLIFKK